MRRHRENKKIVEENRQWVGNFLIEYCNFETTSFRDLVEWIQEDCVLEEDGIRIRNKGKLMHEPDVYVGLNMIVLVDTIHVTHNA